MKRVTTREFLRNINSMTEPVAVYTRSHLKGTWTPALFWENEDIPTSEPVTGLGADAAQAPNEAGTFGVSRPKSRRRLPRRPA